MEWRLFEEGNPPEWTTPEWYAGREAAPHLEQEGHRERLLLTEDHVLKALYAGARDVVDVGSGDGGLLSLFGPHHSRVIVDSAYGFDLQQSNVDAAKTRHADVRLLDVAADRSWEKDVPEGAVIVATEMLEHLVDPHDFVWRLAQTKASWLVASSPYTETDQSHYDFHTWAWDLAGYRALLENNGWSVVRQDTAWISQVLTAVKR